MHTEFSLEELAAIAYADRIEREAHPTTLEAIHALFIVLEMDPEALAMFRAAQAAGLTAAALAVPMGEDDDAQHRHLLEAAPQVYLDAVESTAEVAALTETKVVCARVRERLEEDPGFARLLMEAARMAARIENGAMPPPDLSHLDEPDTESPFTVAPAPDAVGDA